MALAVHPDVGFEFRIATDGDQWEFIPLVMPAPCATFAVINSFMTHVQSPSLA